MLFKTKRCIIRQLNTEDVDVLKSILQDKKVMQHVNGIFNDEQIVKWLVEQIESYQNLGFGMYGIELITTHQFIGICGFSYRSYKKEKYPELSYYFLPAFWHHGYACEVASAMITYGFESLNFTQLISIVKDSNLSSIKVAQHCKMQVVEKYHQYVRFKRQLLLIYSIKNVL